MASTTASGWTAQEIAQQPGVWREVAALLAADTSASTFVHDLLARRDVRVVLTGAGTSAFGGEIVAPALTRAMRRRVDAVATTDLVADPLAALGEDVPTLLVSFARSGDSPESAAATALADELLTEAHHLVLTCNADGALARSHGARADSRVVLMPDRAGDRGFAMTSSITAMVLALLLVTGRTGLTEVEQLAAAVEEALPELDGRASTRTGARRVVHLGSGPMLGVARESSLKLLELTAGRIATWWDSSLGFRHGPKALLDDGTLAVVHVSGDPHTRLYDLDMLTELVAALGAERVLAVSTTPVDVADTWSFPALDGLPDELTALAHLVASQVLALRFSLDLGLEPDDPFPGREVNRVVEGVTIHPF